MYLPKKLEKSVAGLRESYKASPSSRVVYPNITLVNHRSRQTFHSRTQPDGFFFAVFSGVWWVEALHHPHRPRLRAKTLIAPLRWFYLRHRKHLGVP